MSVEVKARSAMRSRVVVPGRKSKGVGLAILARVGRDGGDRGPCQQSAPAYPLAPASYRNCGNYWAGEGAFTMDMAVSSCWLRKVTEIQEFYTTLFPVGQLHTQH